MIIFDGIKWAAQKKLELQQRAQALIAAGKKPKIAALYYHQDSGSSLYTAIKAAVAAEIGIIYEAIPFDIDGGVEPVLSKLKQLNADESATGIIVQKPTRHNWSVVNGVEGKVNDIKQAYDLWWKLQTSAISPNKDVDGLHPSISEQILSGKLTENKRVMPATARAVLEILKIAPVDLKSSKTIILGKSDLLGLPMFNYFLSKKYPVELIGRSELEMRVKNGQNLLDADVIVSATGVKNLITEDLVKNAVVVIDVGEPRGDVDFDNVKNKAAFITPVPGGVGPMTVICLMENCLDMV